MHWAGSKVPITTLGILYLYGTSLNAAFLNRMQPLDLFWVKMHHALGRNVCWTGNKVPIPTLST
jgi:hypothetical protein